MLSYGFLFDLGLILLSTKLLGILTKRFKLPQVVGALLAGIVLGPAVFNVLQETEFIQQMAELGVIILMFCAGLETDAKELKKSGKAAIIIAILGVIVPLGGGFLVAKYFNNVDIAGPNANMLLQNIFIGIILTATSVSITVETLKEMGKLNTKAGNAILGAALIDDILGVIALTIITSIADTSVNIAMVMMKIVMFFVFAFIVGIIFHKYYDRWVEHYNKDKRRFVIFAFVLCLFMAFIAEELFGVADITGAFIAGIILSTNEKRNYISMRFDTISYMLLSPIFFASIGIKVVLPEMSATILAFAVVLLIVAIVSKVIGCYIGAKICKYNNVEAIQIGTGMISRGEVALIVASKGTALGLMSSIFFGPVIIMVVITTIVTPILLKGVFALKENKEVIQEQVI